jgi:hypothetical protein
MVLESLFRIILVWDCFIIRVGGFSSTVNTIALLTKSVNAFYSRCLLFFHTKTKVSETGLDVELVMPAETVKVMELAGTLEMSWAYLRLSGGTKSW